MSAIEPKPRVLVHCQYVYGIGHYVRTVELARGLSELFDVVILNGGEPVPNYDLPPGVTCFQLPAIYKEEHLEHLSPVDPSSTLAECFEARAALLDRLLERVGVDVLITEHFPFGLMFEAEATWLIRRVRERNPHVKVVSSVRDVIESAEGGQQDAHTCALLNQLFDALLVHGDQRVIPFSASFPEAEQIEIPLYHTGYIVQPPELAAARADPPQLVVSIGGGRLGGELLDAALDAHRFVAREWPHQLVLFTGAFQRDGETLNARVEPGDRSGVTINQFSRTHYRQTLASASAVICMAGYNTLLEAVATRLPTLVYRRTFKGKNREQDLRSTLFERAGLIRVLDPDELAPEQMAARILQVVSERERPRIEIRTDGAAEARRRLAELLSG